MIDNTMEEIESMIEDEQIIQRAGYINYAHFEEYKYQVVQGLMRYGSLFCQNLGKALHNADRDNALKILRYWDNTCQTHATLFKMFIAKQKATAELESATVK